MNGYLLLFCCLVLFVLVSTSTNNNNNFSHHYNPTWMKHDYITKDDTLILREEVRSMFYHAYNAYIKYAFPNDEIKPLSCRGKDTFGQYSLTLIDSLTTLWVLGDNSEFNRVIDWVSNNINFDRDFNVSVFESNIRILGGLLSAHLLKDMEKCDSENYYSGKLLDLAVDLGYRLMPAFSTHTNIPYGTVNLKYGVPNQESEITCTAGGGTFALEFGILSILHQESVFEKLAFDAINALFLRRSHVGLVGNHINISSGNWVAFETSVGNYIDSYYEYMIKASILFDNHKYRSMFNSSYNSVNKQLLYKGGPWYTDLLMGGAVVNTNAIGFNSLAAFWPSIQVLWGDVELASSLAKAYHQSWLKFGFSPENLNITNPQKLSLFPTHRNYPLRPEHIESIYYLYRSTKNPIWLSYGRDIVKAIETLKAPCGFAAVKDIETRLKEDQMDSFFLSETLKYLYLLFDESNPIHNGEYIFTTEGHPISVTHLHKIKSKNTQTFSKSENNEIYDNNNNNNNSNNNNRIHHQAGCKDIPFLQKISFASEYIPLTK